eukprot:gb/GECG01001980.1/.p1 GENE.gb/GECG01001980.1/~~gb/GECG01001980.1/.p1  ORF type:complete len:1430 (+),score=220.77 gb/GECG01001980.1/:1-4290(+)
MIRVLRQRTNAVACLAGGGNGKTVGQGALPWRRLGHFRKAIHAPHVNNRINYSSIGFNTQNRSLCANTAVHDEQERHDSEHQHHRTLTELEGGEEAIPFSDADCGGQAIRERLPEVNLKEKGVKEYMETLTVMNGDILDAVEKLQNLTGDPKLASHLDPRTAARVLGWTCARAKHGEHETDHSASKTFGSIGSTTVWDVFESILKSDLLLRDQPASSILITRALFVLDDPKLLEDITERALESSMDIVLSTRNRAKKLEVILTTLCERKLFVLADKVLSELPRYGGVPAPHACLRWMQWLNSHRRYMDSLVVFDRMFSMRMQPNNVILHECLMAAQNSGEYETGLSYWRILTQRRTGRAKVSPDKRSYAAFMELAGRCGLRTQAINALDSMKLRKIIPDARCYVAAIRACSTTGMPQMAFSLFDDMRKQGIEPTKDVFDGLAAVAAESASPDLAAESMKELCAYLKMIHDETKVRELMPSATTYKHWIRSILYSTSAAAHPVRKGTKQRNSELAHKEIQKPVDPLTCYSLTSSNYSFADASLAARNFEDLLKGTHYSRCQLQLLGYCSPFARYFALHTLAPMSMVTFSRNALRNLEESSLLAPWNPDSDLNCTVGAFPNYLDYRHFSKLPASDRSLLEDYWSAEADTFKADLGTVTGIPSEQGALPELGLRWLQDLRRLSQESSSNSSPSVWHYAAVVRSAAAAAEAGLASSRVWAPVVQNGEVYAFSLDGHVAVAEAALTALIEDGHSIPDRLLTPLIRVYLRPELESAPTLVSVNVSEETKTKESVALDFPSSFHWGLWRAQHVCNLLVGADSPSQEGTESGKKLLEFFGDSHEFKREINNVKCQPPSPLPVVSNTQAASASAQIKAFTPLIRLSGSSPKNYYSAEQLLMYVVDKGHVPTKEMMESLLLAAKDAKLPEEAWKVLKAMKEVGHQPDVETVNNVLEAAADMNAASIATQAVQMMEAMHLQPNSLTFEILSRASAAETVRQQRQEEKQRRDEKRPFIDQQREREREVDAELQESDNISSTKAVPNIKAPEASARRRTGVLFGDAVEEEADSEGAVASETSEKESLTEEEMNEAEQEEEEEETQEDESLLSDVDSDLGLTEPVIPGGGREWRDLALSTSQASTFRQRSSRKEKREKEAASSPSKSTSSSGINLREICDDVSAGQAKSRKGRKASSRAEGPLEGLDGMSVVVELDNRPRITVAQLKAWLTNRGVPTSGLKKYQLVSLVRTIAMMSDLLEDYGQTEDKQRWILENSFLPNGKGTIEQDEERDEDDESSTRYNVSSSARSSTQSVLPETGDGQTSARLLARALGQVVSGELDHPVVEKLKQVLSPFSRWTMNRTIDMRGQLAARVILDPAIKLGEAGPKGPYEDWPLLELNSLLHLRLLRQATKKRDAIERLREWDKENPEEVEEMIRQYEANK